jgi:hypothetical protein
MYQLQILVNAGWEEDAQLVSYFIYFTRITP